MTPAERQLEEAVIGKLCSQKYEYRPGIRNMVLIASEQKLLMMRPYQVYQVKSLPTSTNPAPSPPCATRCCRSC